jgi:hypothetical protein
VWLSNSWLDISFGKDEVERRRCCRELFHHELEPGVLDAMRGAKNGSFALGYERICAQITAALGRRSSLGSPGRPKPSAEQASMELFSVG